MDVNIVYLLIVFVVIIISMTLHEAMHAYASFWLGDHTAKLQGRLTLNPIKHIDPFLTILLPLALALSGAPVFGGAKPVPINPFALRYGDWGMALVALAGPITNFVLAFVFFGIWVLTGVSDQSLFGLIFSTIVSVNLGFFVFNMIPIPPLDGSRVMYALAPDFIQRGMEAMERYGIIVIFAILLVGSQYVNLFMSTSISFFFDVFNNIFIH